MGKNYSKNPATDASKVRTQTQVRYFVEGPDGLEERIDRRPMGKVERFVDREGNVVQSPMFVEGDQHKTETERRNRANLHAKGFVELAQCPISSGAQKYAHEFLKMPEHLREQCRTAPRLFEKRGRDVFAHNGCAHVQWLQEYRREEAAKAYALRNAHVAAAAESRAREERIRALQLKKLEEEVKAEFGPDALADVESPRKRRGKAKEATAE